MTEIRERLVIDTEIYSCFCSFPIFVMCCMQLNAFLNNKNNHF